MTPDLNQRGSGFTGARAFPAEGARVALLTCETCGAAILLDPSDTFDPVRRHRDWHKDIDARIDQNRPDPRSAFIGG